jgi:hypothetical protein
VPVKPIPEGYTSVAPASRIEDLTPAEIEARGKARFAGAEAS